MSPLTVLRLKVSNRWLTVRKWGILATRPWLPHRLWSCSINTRPIKNTYMAQSLSETDRQVIFFACFWFLWFHHSEILQRACLLTRGLLEYFDALLRLANGLSSIADRGLQRITEDYMTTFCAHINWAEKSRCCEVWLPAFLKFCPCSQNTGRLA